MLVQEATAIAASDLCSRAVDSVEVPAQSAHSSFHPLQHSGLLASLRHPCLVSFLGMCADPPCLVCEYCPRGSLAQVLQVAAAFPKQAAKLDWLRRLQMVGQANSACLVCFEAQQSHAVG